MAHPNRPQALNEMIGQELLKERARIAIGAALQRGEALPHVLLTSAGGGLGKTSFATILANEMYCPIRHTSGPCIRTAVDLRKAVVSLAARDFLHIDEAHAMGKAAAEELLLVLEEGVINVALNEHIVRLELPPFTLVASTTKPASLSGPLRQRFKLEFHFDFYPVADLERITAQAAAHLGMSFDPEVCRGIAERALAVPRNCIRHAERVRDITQAKGVDRASIEELRLAMNLEGIDQLGLNTSHRRLLLGLDEAAPRGLSARSLALRLGVGVETVMDVLEPPLVRLGFIIIGPGGRRITEPGRQHLIENLSETNTRAGKASGK